jgi:hypothetical protein
MKTPRQSLHKMAKAAQREKAKEAGFYDGRFRNKVVTPKPHKKEKHRRSWEEE